eukprot:Skav210629  [mRNA]  locus=scaffold1063:49329:52854:- [translate_table: standard]
MCWTAKALVASLQILQDSGVRISGVFWAVLLGHLVFHAQQVSAYRESLNGLDYGVRSLAPEKASGDKPSSDAMPVLLLWFLVFDFIFLYLSNTTYTLMRENFFKMVSHTVSIFCALLVEMAVVEMMLEGPLRLIHMLASHRIPSCQVVKLHRAHAFCP